MRNIHEQAQEMLDSKFNLIEECEQALKEQNRQWNILKHDIVEWEGALIRAGLSFKKIEYKGKTQQEWRKWDLA